MTRRRFLPGLLLLAMLATVIVPSALGQAGLEMGWRTIDGGSKAMSGGAFALTGTVGQPDITALTGNGIGLAGGFWPGAAERMSRPLYLPRVLKEP